MNLEEIRLVDEHEHDQQRASELGRSLEDEKWDVEEGDHVLDTEIHVEPPLTTGEAAVQGGTDEPIDDIDRYIKSLNPKMFDSDGKTSDVSVDLLQQEEMQSKEPLDNNTAEDKNEMCETDVDYLIDHSENCNGSLILADFDNSQEEMQYLDHSKTITGGMKPKYSIFLIFLFIALISLSVWAGFYYIYYEDNHTIDDKASREGSPPPFPSENVTYYPSNFSSMEPTSPLEYNNTLEPSSNITSLNITFNNSFFSSLTLIPSARSFSPSFSVSSTSSLTPSFNMTNLIKNFLWKPVKSYVGKPGIAVSISDDGDKYVFAGKNVFTSSVEDNKINLINPRPDYLTYGIDTLVSLSGDGKRLAVGAYRFNNGAGKVQVYHYKKKGIWRQLGAPIIGSEGDFLGTSLKLSSNGTRLAVGAPKSNLYGIESGFARVLQYDRTSSSWVSVGGDFYGNPGDNTGISVSLSDDGLILAVGSSNSSDIGEERGNVDIYQETNTSGAWELLGESLLGEVDYAHFGSSVALSANGYVVAIIADSNEQIQNKGMCRIYSFDGTIWKPNGSDFLGAAHENSLDHNQIALAGDGTRIAISTFYNDTSDYKVKGSVYVLEILNNDWSQLGPTIHGDSFFGHSIDFNYDGSKLGLGSPGNGAYIYSFIEDGTSQILM